MKAPTRDLAQVAYEMLSAGVRKIKHANPGISEEDGVKLLVQAMKDDPNLKAASIVACAYEREVKQSKN
jgi:hypothetical protein